MHLHLTHYTQKHNKDGLSALHLAALYNRSAACQLLLASTPELLGKADRKGRTPAELARRRGHEVGLGGIKGRGIEQGCNNVVGLVPGR